MRKKRVKSAPVGGSYDKLPTVKGRGVDLQIFVDEYVRSGDRVGAFLAAGGDHTKSDTVKRATAFQILELPEVKQAVVERSAQAFFDLAPTAIRVLKEVLEMQTENPQILRTKVQVAAQVMDKVQIEKHHQDKTAIRKEAAAAAGGNLEAFMGVVNEFISKNPEWASKSRRSAVVIDGHAELSDLEEHKPN